MPFLEVISVRCLVACSAICILTLLAVGGVLSGGVSAPASLIFALMTVLQIATSGLVAAIVLFTLSARTRARTIREVVQSVVVCDELTNEVEV